MTNWVYVCLKNEIDFEDLKRFDYQDNTYCIYYLKDGFLFYGLRSDWGLVIIGVVLITGVFINEFFRKK